MHFSYEKRRGHKADFIVRYRFYTEAEGGRKIIPYQGYRADFFYEHPDHSNTNQLFMIHPEFLDECGAVIMENDASVQGSGRAQMWVLIPKMRVYHSSRIKLGTIGYFMEGSRRVAECEVLEFVDLSINPSYEHE